MRNLLPQKDKYLIDFANSVYAEFRRMKYGIESCTRTGQLYVDEMRKDIVNYQSIADSDSLCELSVDPTSWPAVYYSSSCKTSTNYMV